MKGRKRISESSQDLNPGRSWELPAYNTSYGTLCIRVTLSTNLAAPDVAPVSATALLLVADVSAEELSLLLPVGTGFLHSAPPTPTAHQGALSTRRTLTKVTYRLTSVDGI